MKSTCILRKLHEIIQKWSLLCIVSFNIIDLRLICSEANGHCTGIPIGTGQLPVNWYWYTNSSCLLTEAVSYIVAP